jgi:HEAT repeats
MSQKTVNRLLQDYIDAAILHGEASARGNYKVANKQYTNLTRIYKRFEKDKITANNLLGELLQHENTSVRIWAAAHALGLKIETEKAVKTLEEASRDNSVGILRLNAEMTLKEWNERGTLSFKVI